MTGVETTVAGATGGEAMGLPAAVQRVAEARRALATVKAELAREEANFAIAYAPLIDEVAEKKKAVEAAETAAKALAVAAFNSTGEKKPSAGVSIKEIGKIDYKVADAEAWCRDHRHCIVPESVDLKAFDRLVNAMRTEDRPPFVMSTSTPRAELASDLDKALGVAALTDGAQ